jgi:hypothetical protein
MVFETICTAPKTYFEASFNLVYELETVWYALSYKEGGKYSYM